MSSSSPRRVRLKGGTKAWSAQSFHLWPSLELPAPFWARSAMGLGMVAPRGWRRTGTAPRGWQGTRAVLAEDRGTPRSLAAAGDKPGRAGLGWMGRVRDPWSPRDGERGRLSSGVPEQLWGREGYGSRGRGVTHPHRHIWHQSRAREWPRAGLGAQPWSVRGTAGTVLCQAGPCLSRCRASTPGPCCACPGTVHTAGISVPCQPAYVGTTAARY